MITTMVGKHLYGTFCLCLKKHHFRTFRFNCPAFWPLKHVRFRLHVVDLKHGLVPFSLMT